MSEHDPIDALLSDAFAAERRALPAAPIASEVLERIRRRRRVRQTVLGLGIVSGLAATAVSAGPLLAGLGQTLASLLSPLPFLEAGTPASVAAIALLIGLGVVMFLEEEASGL